MPVVALILALLCASPGPAADLQASNPAHVTYIVRLVDKPLAMFDGMDARGRKVSLPFNGIPRAKARNGRLRLDVRSTQAQTYVAFLRNEQASLLGAMAASLGRAVVPRRQMQSALNAIVIDLSPSEAGTVAQLPGVLSIEQDRAYPLTTDIGPGFIGAASVWWGTPAGQDTVFADGFDGGAGYRGDGIVVGVIDSGYNSASPSFSAQDDSGYPIQNPLGSGHFIGQCGVAGISIAGCNDKVIGVYDELDDGSPTYPFSVEDPSGSNYDGHGSHVASTAAGNNRSAAYTDPNPFVPAELATYTTRISGVAPHANLVVFRACGDAFTGCPASATLAAIDQAVADGIVDVLNYSIAGGTAPWTDASSQAFLAATNAGIFVAAAAGNSGGDYVHGRIAGSVLHQEPWVMSVAASMHTGGLIQSLNSLPAARVPIALEEPMALPDQVSQFSGMGPAAFDLIKPEVEAPGAWILAAVMNDGSPAGPARVGLLDGTSMASPHVAGAAALLMGLHPDWTPMEVKSALMMTAKEAGLTTATQDTGLAASTAFDRGAGRIQPFVAAHTGLVLDESGTNFAAADPSTGGDVRTLNLASMQNSQCITVIDAVTSSATCAFTRTLYSVLDHTAHWSASVIGLSGTVTPSAFQTDPGTQLDVIVNVDASTLAADGAYHFGELVLQADDGSPALHMPIAVAVPAPMLATETSLSITVPTSATTGSGTLTLTNLGGPTLNVSNTNFFDSAAVYTKVVADLPIKPVFPRFARSTYAPDTFGGVFAANAFSVIDPVTNLRNMRFPGSTYGGTLATLIGTPLHLRIYPDAMGVPASDPITDAGNSIAAWHFDTTIGSAGVNVDNDVISLDLAQAGAADTQLAPGTYWAVVYPDIDSGGGSPPNGWLWAESAQSGPGLPVETGGPPIGPWETLASLTLTTWSGMAMHLEQAISCGADWLSTSPGSVSLGGELGAQVTVTVDSSQFGGNNAVVGYLCIQSNDPAHPVTAVRISATKN